MFWGVLLVTTLKLICQITVQVGLSEKNKKKTPLYVLRCLVGHCVIWHPTLKAGKQQSSGLERDLPTLPSPISAGPRVHNDDRVAKANNLWHSVFVVGKHKMNLDPISRDHFTNLRHSGENCSQLCVSKRDDEYAVCLHVDAKMILIGLWGHISGGLWIIYPPFACVFTMRATTVEIMFGGVDLIVIYDI